MQVAQPDPAEEPSAGPPSHRPAERTGGPLAGAGHIPGQRAALAELHLKLLDRLGPPSALVDADHEVLHLSPQAGRFLQLRGGEPSRRLLALVDPALRPSLAAALQQAGRSAAEVRSAPVELGSGGERLSLAVRVVPAADLGPGLLLVLFETGPPAAAPAADACLAELEHATRGLLELLEATGIPTVFLDPGLGVRRYTRAATQLFSLLPADAGRRLTDLATPLAYPELAADLERVLQELQPVEREVGDRAGRRFLARLLPYRATGDDLAGVVLSFTDVTERKQADETRRWLSTVVNASTDAIISFSTDFTILSWNAGAERIYGYPAAEVIGRPLFLLAPGREADYHENMRQLRRGEAIQYEAVRRRKDGGEAQISVRVSPIRGADGQVVGGTAIARDISDAMRARQALQEREAELRQALEETQQARSALETADANKDRFLAVLSHELRNPLASIASASELLLMPRLPESARHKAAEVVQRQAHAMKALLDELLDVSRLTLGRLSLERQPVAVASVIQTALEATRPLVQAASHELLVRLPPPAVQVDGDPMRLAQVVSNLVTNAAKYTPESGRIEVSATVFHDEVVIEVSDNGIGMEPSQIERMFDLFSQGEGALDRSNAGLGVGLALARNIVELHGGWIMASSAGLGQGCQVRVGLPLLPESARGAVAGEPPPQQAPEPAVAAEGELILVADDNGDAAWGLAKLLELSGYRAVLARSGGEALQVAEQERPAIALLDIGMPDLSGHEVARRLRRSPWGRDMILIAATGWAQETDIRHSMEAGFDAHLTKPLNVARIDGLIEELAARRKS
ncbi:PAS domain-containing protein [Ramlibacter tataouinensis]|uniref:hybrid sensor histidine kinase/response regulator n=1 Tax=Ramlibacter tataouinensis TaxID=94132 RepID=UPI0022F3CC47|nr:PAS domain-containing protein [Ramlibacter tataouinensis]WBY00381.1 PAS domain-containing protein [Ramlibacter tataouinensis]